MTDKDVDEDLYSRQLYVMGHEGQRKMAGSSVLVVGLKGLGIEIAKNAILAGVKSVDLLDLNPALLTDLASNFYLTKADVGKPRAQSCLAQLTSLNGYVKVRVVEEPLSEELIAKNKYTVVVLTETTVDVQLRINDFCHSKGIKFISGDVHGLLGTVFVDVGEGHTVADADGEREHRGLVAHISRAKVGVVTVHEDHRHGLSDGDHVRFEEVSGMVQLNDTKPRPVRVLTPFSFSIDDTSKYTEYSGSKGYFQQVKVPKTFTHKTMAATMKEPQILDDFLNEKMPLHCLYHALSKFKGAHGRLPAPDSKSDAENVLELVARVATDLDLEVAKPDALLHLARCSASSIAPMTAFLGGVMGQEVLKACSNKFSPLTQYLYFDASAALPDAELPWKEFASQGTRYDDQIGIFGATLQKQLQGASYFLVGAGAIGCEMIKNFALMGVATDEGGKVHVTDMDTIEKSNLNRQFLFRPDDVKKLKSEIATREAKRMNPDIHIDFKALRVGPESEEVYNEDFWNSLSGVVTALDNVEARLYLDQRCILFQKPMVDSGTLGTKGNTQVVAPFLTESYGASRDPPEETIPICTLKNFPSKIEHTIQWAREAFESEFKQAAEDVNNYLGSAKYLAELAKQPNEQLVRLETVHSYLVKEKPLTFDACIQWAYNKFAVWFTHGIRQLLEVFPADSKTKDGLPFWSGAKRPPNPVAFDIQDPLHLDFIVAAANLHAFNYGLKGERSLPYFTKVLKGLTTPTYIPRMVKIAATEEEAKEMAEQLEDDHDVKVEALTSALPAPSSLAGYRLNAIDFEKDDPSNFHMDFMTACSNLRARNYAIKEASKHETKFVSGKIIPAIATTTALVTGLVCIELFKLLQKKPLESYRNTYVNLSLPLVSESDPVAPAYSVAKLKSGDWTWSLWDRVDVDLGDCSLEKLLAHIQEKLGLECNMLSHGASMLYYDFGMGLKKKVKDRLPLPMSQVVEMVGKLTLDPKDKYLVLEACVVDAEGEDVEIPYVRFKFRK